MSSSIHYLPPIDTSPPIRYNNHVPKQMDINRIIGKKIRIQREALGFSQKEMGEKLGVSGSFVGFIENGKRRVSPILLQKIARVTRRPISYFYNEVPDDTALRAFRILLDAKRDQKAP